MGLLWFSIWYFTGYGFAAWAWTRRLDLDVSAAVVLAIIALTGPLPGFVFLLCEWGDDYMDRADKKPPKVLIKARQ
jgi:hypothetical protein